MEREIYWEASLSNMSVDVGIKINELAAMLAEEAGYYNGDIPEIRADIASVISLTASDELSLAIDINKASMAATEYFYVERYIEPCSSKAPLNKLPQCPDCHGSGIGEHRSFSTARPKQCDKCDGEGTIDYLNN